MPIPSLHLQKNEPVPCRETKRLVKQLWSLRFATMQWLCSQLCFVTAANQRTVVEIELLATVGWKWGCRPFSCPCSQNVTHCRKETCWTCLSKESIPTTPFWNSKHPLPARSRFLRATVGSTSSALCLHHAHPLVSAQKQRVWSRSCGLHDFLQCSDCALSCAMWLLQIEIELLATVGWKCGCQPFSCPDLQNMMHCQKEICSTCWFQESIPAIPLGNAKHPLLVRSLRFPRLAAHSTSSGLCLY